MGVPQRFTGRLIDVLMVTVAVKPVNMIPGAVQGEAGHGQLPLPFNLLGNIDHGTNNPHGPALLIPEHHLALTAYRDIATVFAAQTVDKLK